MQKTHEVAAPAVADVDELAGLPQSCLIFALSSCSRDRRAEAKRADGKSREIAMMPEFVCARLLKNRGNGGDKGGWIGRGSVDSQEARKKVVGEEVRVYGRF